MGKFVKKLNSFTWDYFGDGPWDDFYYARGAHEGYFMGKMFGYGKKIAIVEDQKKERSVVVTAIGDE